MKMSKITPLIIAISSIISGGSCDDSTSTGMLKLLITASVVRPMRILETEIPTKYSNRIRSPISLWITPMVARLVAGPARRKTSTVPGDIPARIMAAAKGVEAVAQIYIGMPITSIISIAGSPLPQLLMLSGGR